MAARSQPLLKSACHGCEDFDRKFYARRRLLTLGSLLVDVVTNAMASGFSPLVLPIGSAFRMPHSSTLDTYAEGMFLYVYFIRFSVSILWGFVFLDAAISRHPEHSGTHMAALALWPLGLALLGWAVSHRSVGLVLVAAVLMGIGHGPSKYNGAVLLPSWWAVDGKVRYCQALLGFVRGLGAMLWISFFGGATAFVGEDHVHLTLYMTAIIQACILFIGVAPILSKAEFHQVPKLRPERASSGSSEPPPSCEKEASLLRDWRFYAICIITTSISLCGLGIKQLLAVLYQEGTELSYSASARYAAGSLLLYWLLMTLSPLLGTHSCLLPMYIVALGWEAALYGLSPVAVDTHNVALLLSCRVLSGGLLAITLINKTLLLTEVLGKDKLKEAKRWGAPLDLLGGAGGLVAWLLHVSSIAEDRGQARVHEQDSFNSFFRLSAVMMLCSAFLAFLLFLDQCMRTWRARSSPTRFTS